jgi:CelD/BcsL family acetyltransferase involved in cellulose biosynthesis
MTAVWSIRRFDGLDGLQTLEPDWKRLVAAMPDRGFHHAHETHMAYAHHAESHHAPLVCLGLFDGERIRAICPLQPGIARPFRREIPAWTLPFGLGNVVRDAILPPDHEAEREFLPAVVRFLKGLDPERRWLVFDRVLESSSIARALSSVDQHTIATDMVSTVDVVDTIRTFADLSASLSRKFRSNLRNARTKLAALPSPEFRHITDRDHVIEAFETFVALEATGWKGEPGGAAIMGRPKLAAFFRELVSTLRDSAQCEFDSLYSDGHCIASLFCIRSGREYAIVKTCYDETFARVTPGRLLLDTVIERCCADPGIDRVNLVSHQEWLKPWNPEVLPANGVYLSLHGPFARQWGGLLRARFRYGPRIKALLRRAIDRKEARE